MVRVRVSALFDPDGDGATLAVECYDDGLRTAAWVGPVGPFDGVLDELLTKARLTHRHVFPVLFEGNAGEAGGGS